MSFLTGVSGEDDRWRDECQPASRNGTPIPCDLVARITRTGDRKPGKAFTGLTGWTGRLEEQLPSCIRPGKIVRSRPSVSGMTGSNRWSVHQGDAGYHDVALGTEELSVVLASQPGVEHGL